MPIKCLKKADERFGALRYLKNVILMAFGAAAIEPHNLNFYTGFLTTKHYTLGDDVRRFFATRWSSVADVEVDDDNWGYLCAISQYAFRSMFLVRYEKQYGKGSYQPKPKRLPAWVAARLVTGRPATVREVLEEELKTVLGT